MGLLKSNIADFLLISGLSGDFLIINNQESGTSYDIVLYITKELAIDSSVSPVIEIDAKVSPIFNISLNIRKEFDL